jgi:hypothetical protein
MNQHERWLANYRQHPATVWCSNPKCGNHADGTTVMFISEYGTGWFEPEECSCGGEWLEDQPDEEDDDD